MCGKQQARRIEMSTASAGTGAGDMFGVMMMRHLVCFLQTLLSTMNARCQDSSQLILTIKLSHFLSNTSECLTPTFWSVVSTKLVNSVPSPHGKVCQCQYNVYTNYTNFQSREWFFTLTRHQLLQQQFSGRYQKPVDVTHVSCITNKLKASEIRLKFANLHPWCHFSSTSTHVLYNCIIAICHVSWLTIVQILTE